MPAPGLKNAAQTAAPAIAKRAGRRRGRLDF